jgi:hypothetical protein
MLEYLIISIIVGFIFAPFLRGMWPAYLIVIPFSGGFKFYPWITGIILGTVIVLGITGMIIEAKKNSTKPDLGKFPEPTKVGDPPRFPTKDILPVTKQGKVQVRSHSRALPRRRKLR